MRILNSLFFLSFLLIGPIINAQDYPEHVLTDVKTGCKVLLKHVFAEDSVTWQGGCEKGYAQGKGMMRGFAEGKQTAQYIGEMKDGKPHGQGTFTFWGDRKLQGHFENGEPLFLSPTLIQHLHKQIVSETDPTEAYDGDNNQKQLYYHALIPDGNLKGVVVLMPGTWETTEHLLSSMRVFCSLAFQQKMAVLVPSINQRIVLTATTIKLMDTLFEDAVKRFNLPKNKFVLGGWSMGGIFSMRYTELAKEDASKTFINPVAVFNCDGPCDLATVYSNFKRKLLKNPGQNEPAYGLREFETYCGGSPEDFKQKYIEASPFTRSLEDGGNAKFLLQTPIRIYADVDPVWWMQNRHVDMYDLNALDQTAMIQWLNDHGNKQAEFIHAFQKGIRLEGNRHPHSWSIVEPKECIRWIMQCLN